MSKETESYDKGIMIKERDRLSDLIYIGVEFLIANKLTPYNPKEACNEIADRILKDYVPKDGSKSMSFDGDSGTYYDGISYNINFATDDEASWVRLNGRKMYIDYEENLIESDNFIGFAEQLMAVWLGYA